MCDMKRSENKRLKRELRELAAVAHEREFVIQLAELENAFKDWRAGRLGPFELGEKVHRFHDEPSR